MQLKQVLGWTIGLLAGLFFIWLALSGIDLSAVGGYLKAMETGWILPFAWVALLANIIRGLRWRLLFHNPERVNRFTIVTAMLIGYSANVAVPRLGEVSRCGYVSKNTDVNLGEALASVVIERAIDVLTLLLLLLTTLVFVISDAESVQHLLGVPASSVYQILGYFVLALIVGVLGVYLLHRNRNRFDAIKETLIKKLPFLEKIIQLAHQVLEGLVAVKHLKNWPLFALYTVLIWTLYVLMSFLPFHAISDSQLNGLAFSDAFDVMVISSIGVVIPSPSGVGTYHYFTQKVLVLLHGVGAEAAIAYAIVSHAVMILSILGTTVLFFIADRTKIRNFLR